METILDELNENIMMIKAFESLLQDRSQGFMAFNSSLIKTKSAFEVFDRSKATLRLSLDSLFVYIEQVCNRICSSRSK